MATRAELEQKLNRLIDRLAPEIRAAFYAALANVTDNIILARVVTAIEAGNAAAAFEALNMSPAALRPLTAALETTFEQMGQSMVQTFPKFVRAQFHFDVRNPRAEQWLKTASSQLVTRITEDARNNVREVLRDNMERGINPNTTALDIVGRINPQTGKREGGVLGLSQPMQRYVANARKDLEQLSDRYFTRERRDKRFDSIVRKAIESGKPLDKATIDKLVSRYKDKLLALRGETIGRTEAIQSLNRAQYESYTQSVEAGAAKPNNVMRVWDSVMDSRTRHNHALMDGQEVGIDEPFTTPDGYKLMYPGDTSLGASAEETINCRCRIKFKTDWLADLD